MQDHPIDASADKRYKTVNLNGQMNALVLRFLESMCLDRDNFLSGFAKDNNDMKKLNNAYQYQIRSTK